jgi:putative methionine-R-sulfoxide reductase with GAF domain
MPPRPLDALAFALAASSDLDGALVALAETVAELDRGGAVVLFRYDAASGVLTERLSVPGPRVTHAPIEIALQHLPRSLAFQVAAGSTFVDIGTEAPHFFQVLGLREPTAGGALAMKGIRIDGQLVAVLALIEERRVAGMRDIERVAPAVALFELAVARTVERTARLEAVRALESTLAKVHADHAERVATLQAAVQAAGAAAESAPAGLGLPASRPVESSGEELRRMQQRLRALEQQVGAATAQLEQAHVELHRRSEVLRQRSRTLYLLERVLTLAATTTAPRALADGLLALVGDDMQSQRCSLFLRAPEADSLYLAAARGLAPHIRLGQRIRVGEGVAGRVAASREPLLVVDAVDGETDALLRDDYLTTGSFISFPLVLRDTLIGVVNLTNRVQRGLFVEEDVERVRLLGLVCASVAAEADLAARLIEATEGGA